MRRCALTSMEVALCRWITLIPVAALCLLPAATYAEPFAVELRDQHGQPVAGAVVIVGGDPAPASLASAAGHPSATMDQIDKEFVPHILAVRAGTSVHFPNSDETRHHVYSFSPAKAFELKLYAGVPSDPVIFDRPGEVVLGCNIHDRMLGYIYVVDSARFTQTGTNGRARLENISPGVERVSVWHPRQIGTNPQSRSLVATNADPADVQIMTLELRPPETRKKKLSPLAEKFRRRRHHED